MNKSSIKFLNQTPIVAKINESSSSSSSASITTSNGLVKYNNSQEQHQSTNTNNNNKFYQTFKTLFDIFDPELRGYIDINELELLGANQNEILNDIINHLKRNQNITNFVTFNIFVNAADIVLKRRKMAKSQLKQNYKKTLSEEFNEQQKQRHQQQQQYPKVNNEPFILQNANSFDLNILLEQENCLLNDGLIELNRVKLFFEQRINENRLKKLNILKLKHQNLFSIDKMLLNLNELNNLNKILNSFNQNNWTENNDSFDDDLNTLLKVTQQPVSTPHHQMENNNENICHYDRFIKEKQEKIENLQKEKSNLIRKLFEIKSKINPASEEVINNLNESKNEDYLFS
jgi:hypothetical protein